MKRLTVAALLILSASACGGSSAPKEFVFAIANPSTQAGPNADCSEAASQNVVVINFNSDGHVIVYQGDANTWYLEGPFGTGGGSVTLAGKLTSGTYTFAGEVDVETRAINNPETDDVRTSTVSLTIKDSGANNVTGTITIENKEICSNVNANSGACNFVLPPSGNTIDCITAGTLKGIELPNPDYKAGQTTPGAGSSPGPNF